MPQQAAATKAHHCCLFAAIHCEKPFISIRVMPPKDANSIANSEDPDQTAPLGGSAQFAQTNLSENLGSLWYGDVHVILTDLYFFLARVVSHFEIMPH